MYYEEKVIDGVLHCRTRPDGDWRRMTDEEITAAFVALKSELSKVRVDANDAENPVRLFAWQPTGHGELSFFVCSRSEDMARASVEVYFENKQIRKYDRHGWGTDYYDLSVLEIDEVIWNAND